MLLSPCGDGVQRRVVAWGVQRMCDDRVEDAKKSARRKVEAEQESKDELVRRTQQTVDDLRKVSWLQRREGGAVESAASLTWCTCAYCHCRRSWRAHTETCRRSVRGVEAASDQEAEVEQAVRAPAAQVASVEVAWAWVVAAWVWGLRALARRW